MRLLLSLALIFPAIASANAIQLDTTKFGHLDQANVTACNPNGGINSSCGPTAAVNSFTFLQNMYPTIYGSKLIPHSAGNTAQQDQVDAATTLACYMGCDSTGTTISNFISGKKDYIESVAPGSTIYSSQNVFAAGGIYPTFNYMYNELVDGEDVELLVGFYSFNTQGQLVRTGGHYVTLTGISSPTNDGANGTISFVDPSGGVDRNGIATFKGADGSIRTSTYVSGTNPVTIIEAAVSESPIPEPGTLVLLFGAVPAALWVRARRRN
jgi:hypothetical protein